MLDGVRVTAAGVVADMSACEAGDIAADGAGVAACGDESAAACDAGMRAEATCIDAGRSAAGFAFFSSARALLQERAVRIFRDQPHEHARSRLAIHRRSVDAMRGQRQLRRPATAHCRHSRSSDADAPRSRTPPPPCGSVTAVTDDATASARWPARARARSASSARPRRAASAVHATSASTAISRPVPFRVFIRPPLNPKQRRTAASGPVRRPRRSSPCSPALRGPCRRCRSRPGRRLPSCRPGARRG